MKTRLIQVVGKRCELVTEWKEPATPCTSQEFGPAHRGVVEVSQDAFEKYRRVDFEANNQFPIQCQHCGDVAPANGKIDHWMRSYTTYDSTSGRPEPGDVYWSTHEVGQCFYQWQNCDGRHLMVVLPNGRHWDVMSRASNCTMNNDHLHRCWVLHQLADGVFHVDKNGLTCQAGAGSIVMDDFHGFLHNGILCKV